MTTILRAIVGVLFAILVATIATALAATAQYPLLVCAGLFVATWLLRVAWVMWGMR